MHNTAKTASALCCTNHSWKYYSVHSSALLQSPILFNQFEMPNLKKKNNTQLLHLLGTLSVPLWVNAKCLTSNVCQHIKGKNLNGKAVPVHGPQWAPTSSLTTRQEPLGFPSHTHNSLNNWIMGSVCNSFLSICNTNYNFKMSTTIPYVSFHIQNLTINSNNVCTSKN